MEFRQAVANVKEHLRISDSQIGRDVGRTRQWVGLHMHSVNGATPKAVQMISTALIRRIDREITQHAEEVSRLERLRADLMSGEREEVMEDGSE